MAEQEILIFLQQYGYWIMLPFMVLEGPIVTMAAAMLASFGVFNIWIVFVLSLLGDLIGDVILYFTGAHFGGWITRRWGSSIGMTNEWVEKMREKFISSGGKIIFIVKSTTGLCAITFLTAGWLKMQFFTFLWYTFLGGLVWSGFLTFMGYFYGYLWREISQYISWIGWVVSAVAITTLLSIRIFQKQRAKEF